MTLPAIRPLATRLRWNSDVRSHSCEMEEHAASCSLGTARLQKGPTKSASGDRERALGGQSGAKETCPTTEGIVSRGAARPSGGELLQQPVSAIARTRCDLGRSSRAPFWPGRASGGRTARPAVTLPRADPLPWPAGGRSDGSLQYEAAPRHHNCGKHSSENGPHRTEGTAPRRGCRGDQVLG